TREIRTRNQAVEPLAPQLRFGRVLVELGGAAPVLTAHYVALGNAGDHLRGAPAGRFRMRYLLVLQIDVDGVVSRRRIERRVHVVVEGEAAGAVEDHVPPGRAVGTVAQIARPIEILRWIHQR